MGSTKHLSSPLLSRLVVTMLFLFACILQATAAPSFPPVPTFTPVAGTYGSAQNVTISDTLPGCTFFYTTDGTDPKTSITVWTGPLVIITANTTVKAYAQWSTFKSSIVTGNFFIKTAAPVFDPAAGIYDSAQTVTISSATTGATIKYTTDGSDPKTSGTAVEGTSVYIDVNTTLKAYASLAGMTDSNETSGDFGIRCATPEFSPTGGSFYASVTVFITTTTPGASIRYTVDGSDPDPTNSFDYNPASGVVLTSTSTLKAYAYLTGMTDSQIASDTYTRNYLPPTITAFAPTYGVLGTVVTVFGTEFVDVSAVKFNGIDAIFNVIDAAHLTAKVPALATTGKISVTTPGGTVESAVDFRIFQPITLSAAPVSPTITGLPVALTAAPTGTGSGSLEYRFRAKYTPASGPSVFTTIQEYSTSATCTWTPSEARDYTLIVYARGEGMSNPYIVYRELPFTVKLPVSSLALNVAPVSPTAVGNQIKMTAVATSGAKLEYQFRAKYTTPGGSVWTTIRSYGSNPICFWTPTEAQVFTIIAYVREQGTTIPYAAYREYIMTVKPAANCLNVKMTPYAQAAVNTPITFSVTPVGGGTMEYAMKVKYWDGGAYVWSNVRDYSKISDIVWTPTEVHEYLVYIYGREVSYAPGTPYSVYKEIPYSVLAVAPAGPNKIDLGTAGDYVILAKTGIANTGTATISGNVGLSPAFESALTGFAETLDVSGASATSTQVSGKIFTADMAAPTPAKLTAAGKDMTFAYNEAEGRLSPDDTDLNSGILNGDTFVPGLYKWNSSVAIAGDINISGGANDVWIFQITDDLLAAHTINLTGGAQAKNIYWQVGGKAIFGASADFKGIILCKSGIKLNSGAVLTGRALAVKTVTLEGNTVTQP